MAWRLVGVWCVAGPLLAGCCAEQPPLDVTRIQAELAAPSRSQDPAPKAEHRTGGGVEVLVFSPGVNTRDYRFGNSDAEKTDLIRGVGVTYPSECSAAGADKMIARIWGVSEGAFSRPGVTEKLAYVRIERCGIPTRDPHYVSWLLGLFDGAGRLVARIPLPEETTLERAPDLFGEGRKYVVLVTRTGPDDAQRAAVKLARIEGDGLATVAESESMDARCSDSWHAAAFMAVLRPGKAPEFRTMKTDARCERR